MGPREWVMAKAQFAVIFGERFTRAMAALCPTRGPHTEILTVPVGPPVVCMNGPAAQESRLHGAGGPMPAVTGTAKR